MELKKLKQYIIKKDDNTDMLSSLKKVNSKLINKVLEEHELKNIEELARYLIEEFDFIFDMSKDDIFTRMFFDNLIKNENKFIFSPYESDVENFIVFAYELSGHYSYYIPDEIKKIIKDNYKI